VYRNRGDNSTRRRVWIQGRFRKPIATPKEKDSITRPLSNGSIDNYSATAAAKWENYYKTLATSKSSPLRVPTNLFQIFPNEFSPWQSLMKQHIRGNRRGGNEQNIQPSYHDGGISDCVTIVDLGCGLAANSSLLDLTDTLQRQQQQHPDEENNIPTVKVHFLDISATAIQQLCDDERYKSGLASGSVASHVHDIRQPWALDESADKRFDLVLLLFTLSSIGPFNCEDMKQTVINAVNMLKQGGVLLFRDYGRYDDDQLQLNSIPGAQLHNNFYLRSEMGTGCYFFDLDEVRELFVGAGLEVLQLEYTTRTYKKTGKSSKDLSKNGGAAERKRIFVDARFRKP
jgi:SAM-dependent methyltransferase